MKKVILLVAAMGFVVAGCFPILLHVNDKGQVLIPRAEGVFSLDAKTGRVARVAKCDGAAWARWSPDGKTVLLAAKSGNDKTTISVQDASGGAAKKLADFGAVACAFWSRDGKTVSVAEAGMNGVTLKKIDVATGKVSRLMDGAMASHQWLPDGTVAVIKSLGDVEGSNVKKGQFQVLDPATGKARDVAEILCENDALFDVSPDGKSALVVTASVKKGKQEGQVNVIRKLVKIDLASGALTEIPVAAPKSGFWSPDGKQMLILKGESAPAGMGNMIKRSGLGQATEGPAILVADADGKNMRLVVKGAVTNTGGMPGTAVYPVWVGNDTVLHFVEKATYGTAAKSLRLVRTSIDGKTSTDLQYAIERGIAEAMKAK
jgi:Tol biopolymer transport system component